MSEENRKNNTTCQFLVKYKDMVTILFEFINASRSRNWLAHVNTHEEIIPYVTAMGTNQVSQNANSLFIRSARIRGKGPKYVAVLLRWTFFCSNKSYSGNCKRCGPCRCTGKQKTKDSRSFSRYHKTRKQREQFFPNIACCFRDRERTKRSLSFAKERNKNSPCIESTWN